MHSVPRMHKLVLATNSEPREISQEITNLADDCPMYNCSDDGTFEKGSLEEGVSTTRRMRVNRPAFDNIY